VYGSSVIYLLRKAAASPPTPGRAHARDFARHWTPVHVDFVVADIDQAVARAGAAGATRESECIEWRGSKCVTFSDPFGHGFCLIEFAGDGYE
jgi:predicted enzyme related to lactoylglutathione lyase